MKKMVLVATTFVIVAAAIYGLTQLYKNKTENSTPSTKTDITLSMGYIPNIQFTPFYAAVENGYFDDAGLNVTFDYAMAPDIIQLVGSGETKFAITDGDQVLLARGQDLPVVSILTLYQQAPVSIVSLTSSNIASPQDLIGKKVGLPGFYGTSYTMLQAFLEETLGERSSEVNLEPIGYTQVPTLTSGQVDAVVVFANNEPMQLTSEGYSINEIKLTDYVTFVGAVLIANEDMINSSPDVVKAIVHAIKQGMEFTQANNKEAFDIAVKNIPDLSSDLYPVQQQVLEKSIALWQSETTTANGLGYQDASVWESTQTVLRNLDLLTDDKDYATSAFTNSFF